jgi:hypothetical protein
MADMKKQVCFVIHSVNWKYAFKYCPFCMEQLVNNYNQNLSLIFESLASCKWVWHIVVSRDFWCSSGWFTSRSWLVGWFSTTTMCSGSLISLLDLWGVMEEVMGGQVNCWLPSGLSPVLKESGGELAIVNQPLPWTYPQGASIPAPWIQLYLSAATQS